MTPTIETWRSIPGWEGYYEASDLGHIRSVERMVYAGSGRYRRNPSKVLAPQAHNAHDGRRIVKLCAGDGRSHPQRIAPLVLTAFTGPRPEGMECCHNDGDETNDRLENLRWDTRSANRWDAVRHGTAPGTRQTHCLRGHALRLPNLTPSMLAVGRRQCLACSRGQGNVRHAQKRGLSLSLQAVSDAHYAQIMRETPCPASSSRTPPSAP